jgi:hypothetical protein
MVYKRAIGISTYIFSAARGIIYVGKGSAFWVTGVRRYVLATPLRKPELSLM